MRAAVRLFNDLKNRYGHDLPFKQICDDEGIIAQRARLADSINGLYLSSNEIRFIIINANLNKTHRRCYGWHELYHHFTSVCGATFHYADREERRAGLFASLCMIPRVEYGDTIDSLIDRYGVCMEMAAIRLDHERKTMMA